MVIVGTRALKSRAGIEPSLACHQSMPSQYIHTHASLCSAHEIYAHNTRFHPHTPRLIIPCQHCLTLSHRTHNAQNGLLLNQQRHPPLRQPSHRATLACVHSRALCRVRASWTTWSTVSPTTAQHLRRTHARVVSATATRVFCAKGALPIRPGRARHQVAPVIHSLTQEIVHSLLACAGAPRRPRQRRQRKQRR